MARIGRYLAIIIGLFGVLSIVIGSVFIAKALDKNDWMKGRMREEKITLGLSDSAIAKGDLVDDAAELQKAGDTITGHRHNIAPTYNDLITQSGGKFDPTNTKDVTYMQALNLENYLYLGVLGFGVTEVVIGIGVFMIVVGLALGLCGVLLWRLGRKSVQAAQVTA